MSFRPQARHGARRAALQMLYQWEVGGAPIDRTIEAYWWVREQDAPEEEAANAGEIDREFAERLVRGTAERLHELDPPIAQSAEHWRLSRMTVIDRLILRMASYELRHEPSTPPAVVINEALELARTYSTEEAVRFINGVLDALARGGRSVRSSQNAAPDDRQD